MYNALLRPFSVVGPPGVGLFPVVLAGFLDEKQGIFLSVNDGKLNGVEPVSYTHLTLPTIYSV